MAWQRRRIGSVARLNAYVPMLRHGGCPVLAILPKMNASFVFRLGAFLEITVFNTEKIHCWNWKQTIALEYLVWCYLMDLFYSTNKWPKTETNVRRVVLSLYNWKMTCWKLVIKTKYFSKFRFIEHNSYFRMRHNKLDEIRNIRTSWQLCDSPNQTFCSLTLPLNVIHRWLQTDKRNRRL